MNLTENEEKKHLARILERLRAVLKSIDEMVEKQARELLEAKQYLYENKTGMDRMEKFSVRQSVSWGAAMGEESVARKNRIHKLLDSPYFGRIDFSEGSSTHTQQIYIGIHSFFDEEKNTNIIHDWRAPVSSMFYDFETGEASYEAPGGIISGRITLKRQYRIRRGKMEYMIDNLSNVYDDILQKELSKSADDKMKHIVATIQRDQNAIVRNETSQVLIIQGVAGSGKTSIALHRVAFLLYRFKESLKAENILIISPNKVYADYIANVLPELGEERVPEAGMEEIAAKALENKYRFQSFYEQVVQLLEKHDPAYIERIRFKASYELIASLDQYLVHVENEFFKATDIWLGRSLIPAWFTEERFQAHHRLPIMERFARIVQDIEVNVKKYYNKELETAEKNDLKKTVTGMFRITNLRDLYREFYQWIGKPELFRLASRSRFEYADVFPLIYLKFRFTGNKPFENVRHLLIDEMQDYTPIQYAVLARLFVCNKTILGDSYQKVNPYASSDTGIIKRVFPTADVVLLRRSYRSSYEITNFAQQIFPNKDLIAIERHGEDPVVKCLANNKEELSEITLHIDSFHQTSYHSFGIICKTQKQAETLYAKLKDHAANINLLDSQSASFAQGITITSVHLAKGLEFDQVLLPFVNATNYQTETDRSLLYIACTRAMHALIITCHPKENLSRFVSF